MYIPIPKGLNEKEKRMLNVFNRMSPERQKRAIAEYKHFAHLRGDNPEFMGIFPLFAAIGGLAKKAFNLVTGGGGGGGGGAAPVAAPSGSTGGGFKLPGGMMPWLLGGGLLIALVALKK
jgi:hypothetical protein